MGDARTVAVVDRFREHLAQRSGAGLPTEFWWRDDDLVDDCDGFRHLAWLARSAGISPLVAVIPARAQPGLADLIPKLPEITFCQHGYAHISHEPPGMAKSEFGEARTEALVRADIANGRQKMEEIFGRNHAAVFVPPWNRFLSRYFDILVEEMFTGFSGSGGLANRRDHPNLRCVDINVGALDWGNPPTIRDVAVLIAKLADIVKAAGLRPRAPIGILTHHRVMDARAWQTMAEVFSLVSLSPGAVWRSPGGLFALDAVRPQSAAGAAAQ